MTVVPMFWPMMMGMATALVTAPVALRACRIPTEAEEDWMTAVSAAPARTPRMGLVKTRRRLAKVSLWARGATAPLMVSIPAIRTAKPKRAVPASRRTLRLDPSTSRMPMRARTGVKEEGFRSFSTRLSPWMPLRLRSQAVTVVPMLAPMMTPMAWRSSMRPEFTKPTTMTVVAEEDWITAVTPRPSSSARRGLPVMPARMFFSREPAAFSRASPMMCMPKRKRARPPMRSNTSKMLMRAPSRRCAGISPENVFHTFPLYRHPSRYILQNATVRPDKCGGVGGDPTVFSYKKRKFSPLFAGERQENPCSPGKTLL